MSWDVSFYNFAGCPPAAGSGAFAEGTPTPPGLVPLGNASAVRNRISASLRGVDWSDPVCGFYRGDGFSLEFNIGRDDTIEHMMVHARGSGFAIQALVAVASPNAWSVLDWTTGKFLDLERPSQEGWDRFRSFRDRAAQLVRKFPW